MIPANIIEEIRNKAEIVKIISKYVQLKKRGKNFVGLCPFHSEKAPSFTVSPEKQLFHCFGCNEGGNVFAFIMKIENIGFAESVEELGKKTGIEVPKSSIDTVSKSENEKLYRIMEIATDYFKENINQAAGYLNRRQISAKTIDKFSLGFVPDGWENLFNRLISRGVDPKLAVKTGLITPREGKSGYYDRFRNRLIFPIYDHRNRSIAIGGRLLGDEEPKYLNSPETSIYHKGEILFGLNLSKDFIKNQKQAILVEGYFDLITPFQAGITNIVATLGTALTSYQCKLLSRYTDTTILAFDADSAGGTASERSIEILRSQGIKVKVAQLTGGKDPDEVINKQGKTAFQNSLDSALPYLEFKLKRIASRYNLSEIESRANALKEMAAILGQEKDNFTQKEYIKMAASILKTEPDTVLAETKRTFQLQTSGFNQLKRITEKPNSKVIEAEKNLIALSAQSRQVLEQLKQELNFTDFNLPAARAIAELLFTTDLNDQETPAHFLMGNLPDESAKSFLSGLILSEHLGNQEQNTIFNDCVQVLKSENKKSRINALKQEIALAEKEGKSEEAADLLSVLKSEIG